MPYLTQETTHHVKKGGNVKAEAILECYVCKEKFHMYIYIMKAVGKVARKLKHLQTGTRRHVRHWILQ